MSRNSSDVHQAVRFSFAHVLHNLAHKVCCWAVTLSGTVCTLTVGKTNSGSCRKHNTLDLFLQYMRDDESDVIDLESMTIIENRGVWATYRET